MPYGSTTEVVCVLMDFPHIRSPEQKDRISAPFYNVSLMWR